MSQLASPKPEPVRTPRSRPALYQIGMWLLLLLLLTPVVLFTIWSHRARQQRNAIKMVRVLGGEVRYDFQASHYYNRKQGPNGPKWLINFLGVDYFATVPIVNLGNQPVTDADLIHLSWLSGLERVHLSRTQITDAGLLHLQRIATMQELYAAETQVTDAGVARLRKALPKCIVVR